MKKTVLVFVGTILMVLFQNCAQDVSFKTEGFTDLSANGEDVGNPLLPKDPGDDTSTPAPTGAEKQEQFKVTFSSESAPLDMIWVIDNSGSMTQEAASVRKNFEAFLVALNQTTNFRLLLISLEGATGTAVNIPNTFDPLTHKQINYMVGSTDGPEILLAQLRTLPAGFLRDNSKKIMVFVTDDNSRLSSTSFFETLVAQQNWARQDVSVSAFTGLSFNLSPCIAKPGTVYHELALQTKGQIYDICASDWSGHFTNLVSGSISKAVRRFTLNAAVVTSIVQVKIDGILLAAGSYSLSGNILTLADTVNLTENSIVTVIYK